MSSISIMLRLLAAFSKGLYIFQIRRVLVGGSSGPLFVTLVPFIFSFYCFLLFPPACFFSQVAITDFNSGSHDPLFALSRVMTGQILRPWEIMLAKSHKKLFTARAVDKTDAIPKWHNSNLSPAITFHNVGQKLL